MAIYHLSVNHGTRDGGQSALAKLAYISRTGEYENRTDLVHRACGNLPAWAAGDEAEFWRAADLWSRLNARLFTEIECALPIELDRAQQVALSEGFASSFSVMPDRGVVPWSLAIHHKNGNPHLHFVLSTRIEDSQLPRANAKAWFKRANSAKPATGGAAAWSRETTPEWLENVRALWAEAVNEALKAAQSSSRVDHRSHERRGLKLAAQKHVGWRGGERRDDVLEYNKRAKAANEEYMELERQLRALRAQDAIEQLEAAEAAKAVAKRFREKNLAGAREDEERTKQLQAQAELLLLQSADSVRPLAGTIALTQPRPDLAPEFVAKHGRFGWLYIRMPDDQLAMLDAGLRIKVLQGNDEVTRGATLRLASSRWQEFEVRCARGARAAWWKTACELGVQHRLHFVDDGSDNDGGGHSTPPVDPAKSRARSP